MKKQSTVHEQLSCLSIPLRTRLLRLLEREELSVGELAEILQLPQPTVSRHLRSLLDQGWLSRRRERQARLYQLSPLLSPADEQLWALVRESLAASWEEDKLRLASVLAARASQSRDFFSQIAEHWQSLRHELYGDQYLLPAFVSLLSPELKIADLGCGPGDTLTALQGSGATLIGVDREPAMLRNARRRLGDDPRVTLHEGELEALPIDDGALDVALLILVLHLLPKPRLVLQEVVRVLRPGGHLVLLDMIAHERQEYRISMGHQQLGFGEEQLVELAPATLQLQRYQPLPPQSAAKGPPLFLSIFTRRGAEESTPP